MMAPPGGSPQPPAPGGGAPPPSGGQPGGAPQGGSLSPEKIQKLAQALDPDNADTLMQVIGAMMKDAFAAIQKAGSQGQPQPGAGGPPPGGPPMAGGGAPPPKPGGQLPPQGGMMGQI